MDKRKRFIKFLLYSTALIFIFLTGEHYRMLLLREMGRTYYILSVKIFSIAFPIMIGILIAVPHLAREAGKKGKWQYNWSKSLAIVIPALYILLYFPLAYSPLAFLTKYLYPYSVIFRTVMANFETLNFVGMAIGYFGLTGLYKETVKRMDVELI
jgi:hypothetical protein